jgi:hypothetical protein
MEGFQNMLKHIIAIVLLSVLIILALPQVQTVLHWLMDAYNWLAQTLTQVFSGGKAGNTTRELIAILILPFLIGLLPAIPYYFIRRSFFPYFMTIVWVVWLIEVTAIALSFKLA